MATWNDLIENNTVKAKSFADTVDVGVKTASWINTVGNLTGLRTKADDEVQRLTGGGSGNSRAMIQRNFALERKRMIEAKNRMADQGLGTNASTMSPTHVFSRISRAAKLHGNGQIGNLDWGTLFRAGIGDNNVLYKPAAEKDEAKEPELNLGFQRPRTVPLEEAYGTWSSSKRTPKDNSIFLDAADNLVNQSLRMYAGGVNAPHLKSRARMLALEAAEKYDPNKAKLNTHMLSYMQQLKRTVANTRGPIKVPEAMQYDAIRMREKEEELRDRYDRDPTDEELSEALYMPMRRIARIRKASAPQMFTGSVLDGEPQPGVIDDDEPDMWADFVYHDLGTTDKLIFEHRTGYNGKPKLGVTELAKKLGISAGMVSKRAEAIAAMVNNRPKGW